MGYWPAKLIAILNAILMIGYGIIACIIAGQMLSAVNGGHMTIIVGIVIAAVIIGFVAVFGMAVLHVYERYVTWDPPPPQSRGPAKNNPPPG